CRDIATGDTIRTRSGKIVSQQRSIESGGYGKRHSGAESLNAAQLPAFNDAIALERQSVHGVQREVMANIVAAIALVGRAVVGIESRIADAHAIHDLSEVLHSVRVHFDLRRIVIAEGKQVDAAGADVTDRECRFAKDFALDV